MRLVRNLAFLVAVVLSGPVSAQFSSASGSSCVVETEGGGKAGDTKKGSPPPVSFKLSDKKVVYDSGTTTAKITPADYRGSASFFAKASGDAHKADTDVPSGGASVKADSASNSAGITGGDPTNGGGSYWSGGSQKLGGDWVSSARAETAYAVTGKHKLKTTSTATMTLIAEPDVGTCYSAAFVGNSGPGLAVHEVTGVFGADVSYMEAVITVYAIYYDAENELQMENYGVTSIGGTGGDELVGYGQEELSDVTVDDGPNMAKSEASSRAWGNSFSSLFNTESLTYSSGQAKGSAVVTVQ